MVVSQKRRPGGKPGGVMGDCLLIMFAGRRQPHPTRPDEEVPVWLLFVQEGDPDRRPRQREPEGGEP
jgi:hypothetical protein